MSNLHRCAKPLLALQLAAGCSAPAADHTATEERAPTQSAVPQAAPKPPERRRVLAFGDSLYAGFGMAPSQSFPAALQRALASRGIQSDVVNAGVSGDTTAGGRARLQATLDRLQAKPDLVILGLGANDALRGLPPAQTRRNLEAMLSELEERGIPVLLTGITAPAGFASAYFAQYEAIYPELARRYGAALEPSLLEGVLTRREYLLPDGVHPNPEGARRMAERVAPLAAKQLDEAAQEQR